MGADRNSFVDVLRGLAILAVIAVHSANRVRSLGTQADFPWSGALYEVMQFGLHGVQLFFAISGYLLASLYPNIREKSYTTSFYKRRLARIYPLWLVFAGATFLAWILGASGEEFGFDPYANLAETYETTGSIWSHPIVAFLLTITLLGWLVPQLWNTTVLGGWSIYAELQNYILFQIFYRRRSLGLVEVAVVLGAIEMLAPHLFGGSPLSEILTRIRLFSSLSFFIIGIAAWEYVSRRVAGSHAKMPIILATRPAVTLIWGALFMVSELPYGTVEKALIFLLASIILARFIIRSPRLARVFLAFGKYSYSIYFLHFLILLALKFVSRDYFLFSMQFDLNLQAAGNSLAVAFFVFTAVLSVGLGSQIWRFEAFFIQKFRS